MDTKKLIAGLKALESKPFESVDLASFDQASLTALCNVHGVQVEGLEGGNDGQQDDAVVSAAPTAPAPTTPPPTPAEPAALAAQPVPAEPATPPAPAAVDPDAVTISRQDYDRFVAATQAHELRESIQKAHVIAGLVAAQSVYDQDALERMDLDTLQQTQRLVASLQGEVGIDPAAQSAQSHLTPSYLGQSLPIQAPNADTTSPNDRSFEDWLTTCQKREQEKGVSN